MTYTYSDVIFRPAKQMREALTRFAEYMAKNAPETAQEEAAGSIAKKQRTENPVSHSTSVPSTAEIVVRGPVKEMVGGSTESSSEDESQQDKTPRTVEVLRPKSTSTSDSREKMRSEFVSLRPDYDEKCKLKFKVNPRYCAGAKPYKHSPLNPKVFVAAIEIKRVKNGLNKMLLSPGMLVQLYEDSSNLNYIVHDILCYTNEPHRSTVIPFFPCFLMVL